MTSALAQTGCRTLQDDIAVAKGIQWCPGIGCNIQFHVEEYGDTWWYVVTHDAAQQVLGALPPRRLMDQGIGCTIGCSSPRIDGDILEHLWTPCLAEIVIREGY